MCAVLEGECRAAINTVGLEASVGFLHETSSYQTKQWLVYDLQEPFRWLADVAVIEAFESGALDLSDFYFIGDDYRYRFEAGAKQRFIQVLRERLNSGAKYRGRMLKWDTVVEQKITELGRFLIGKTSSFDSAQPVPSLERMDSRELRSKILALTQLGARELGIGKSKCHYLREKARCSASFRFHSKVRRLLTSPVVAREMERES